MNQKEILETIANNEIKQPVLKHCLMAFVGGGCLALLAQFLQFKYMDLFALSSKDASSYVIVTIMLVSSILTCLNGYEKLVQIFGAGLFVPISGFANALTSAALDAKKEGFIQGIGCNMFKLAGCVLTYGIVSSAILAFIRYLL